MKLALRDIDKRTVITFDKSIISDNISGIIKFGADNDYPQIVDRIINSSPTAKAVVNIYASFLAGYGFENELINDIVIGKNSIGNEITVHSLLRDFCKSIAKNQGGYIHCNVNMEGIIGDCRLVPFKNCRFAAFDDNGYTAKIEVYENWEKDSENRKNANKAYDKSNIKSYNTFNLTPEVLKEQISKIGIEKFKGQIYFAFLDNEYIYPLSTFDEVLMDCDTEAQVSIYKNNMTRNGMTKKTIIRMVEPSNSEDEAVLIKEIKKWQGTDGDNILVIYDDIDPETGELKKNGAFAMESVDTTINDKLFEGWQKELANNIRKCAKGMPAILIDYEDSKLGTTSGEAIIQATNFYNAMTESDRTFVSKVFSEILKNFDNEILKNNDNWKIKPLNLYGSFINVDTAANTQTAFAK